MWLRGRGPPWEKPEVLSKARGTPTLSPCLNQRGHLRHLNLRALPTAHLPAPAVFLTLPGPPPGPSSSGRLLSPPHGLLSRVFFPGSLQPGLPHCPDCKQFRWAGSSSAQDGRAQSSIHLSLWLSEPCGSPPGPAGRSPFLTQAVRGPPCLAEPFGAHSASQRLNWLLPSAPPSLPSVFPAEQG